MAQNTAAISKSSQKMLNAIRNNDGETVRRLLKPGLFRSAVDVNETTNHMSFLIFAIQCASSEIIDILLDAGADIHMTGGWERSPAVWHCVTYGKVSTLKRLVQSGVKLNDVFSYNKKSVLMHAVEYMNLEIAKYVADNVGDLDVQDEQGRTALMYAVRNGNVEMLSYLLSKGANPTMTDKFDNTALTFAVSNGHLECFNILIQHNNGALCLMTDKGTFYHDIARTNPNYSEHMIDELLNRKLDINAYDKDGNTPLCIAVKNGYTALAEQLITKGADVNKPNKDGVTPLMLAAGWRKTKSVEMLLQKGAEINACDNTGKTALMWATTNVYNSDIFDILLENKADVRIKDNCGRTVLHYFNHHKNDSLKKLMDNGAVTDMDCQDNEGNTPLMSWIESENGRCIVEELLKYGVNVNLQNKNGMTALMSAAKQGDVRLVESLTQYAVDMNIQNAKGETAMIVAAQNGHAYVVEQLLGKGARTDVLDNEGYSARDYIEKVDSYTTQLLKEAAENQFGCKDVGAQMKQILTEEFSDVACSNPDLFQRIVLFAGIYDTVMKLPEPDRNEYVKNIKMRVGAQKRSVSPVVSKERECRQS